MPWVGISDLGAGWDVLPNMSSGVELSNSRFTFPGGVSGYLNFSVRVIGAGDVRLRVTAEEYSGEGGHEGNVYLPASFEIGAGGEFVQGNEAPPYPSSNFPSADGVASFEPTQFDAMAGEGEGVLRYTGATYTSDGLQLEESWTFLVEAWVDQVVAPKYNCECDDGAPTVTLKQMRERLARRLGFSVQVSMGALPPGMSELLDDFIRSAHEFMYRRYSVMRLRRMFTWDLAPGERFYDIDGNSDACPRVLNPDRLEWVGISQGDLSWRPLICGINPVLYGSPGAGIPSHYEIRQCIEVWPAPVDATWKLRIKGDFGPSEASVDSDVLTVDPEAVFLQALANAKAHYGQADAANYASQATTYIRSRVAGSHQTRRYIPGDCARPAALRPLMKED